MPCPRCSVPIWKSLSVLQRRHNCTECLSSPHVMVPPCQGASVPPVAGPLGSGTPGFKSPLTAYTCVSSVTLAHGSCLWGLLGLTELTFVRRRVVGAPHPGLLGLWTSAAPLLPTAQGPALQPTACVAFYLLQGSLPSSLGYLSSWEDGPHASGSFVCSCYQ